MATDRLDEAFWVYLDRLHAWQMQRFLSLWRTVSARDFAGSYQDVYASIVSLHGRGVAAALFASDDYVLMKAAAEGWWVNSDWRDAKAWYLRPGQLRGGEDAADILARVPYAMKWGVKEGLTPERALALGQARVSRVLGTEAHAVARNYTNEFVSQVHGPEPRALSARERAERLERFTSRDGDLPTYGEEVDSSTFKQWRRVPRPGACDFCLMLATRGAVYATRRSALRGADGRKYHQFCRCRAQLVVETRLADEVAVGPEDAGRTVKYKARSGLTYTYDIGSFNVIPPLPSWL